MQVLDDWRGPVGESLTLLFLCSLATLYPAHPEERRSNIDVDIHKEGPVRVKCGHSGFVVAGRLCCYCYYN